MPAQDPAAQSLHPQLAAMRNRYLELVQAVSDGALDPDDALGTLSQLGVFDGQRTRWSINEEGQFTRQRDPQSPPQAANPSLFAPARAPQAPGPPADPHANPSLATPRTVGGPSPSAAPAPMPAPAPLPVEDAPPMSLSDGPVEASGPSKKKRKSSGPRELPGPLARVVEVLADNRWTAVVVAVCVVLVAAAVLTRPSSEEPPAEVIDPPAVTDPDDEPEGSSTTAGPAGSLPTPSTAAPAPATPSGERAQEVASVLVSGNADSAAQVVEGSGAPAVALLEAARFAGLERLGLALDVSAPPSEDGPAAASQRWSVTSADGVAVAELDVTWVRLDSGTWRLDGWPTLVTDPAP